MDAGHGLSADDDPVRDVAANLDEVLVAERDGASLDLDAEFPTFGFRPVGASRFGSGFFHVPLRTRARVIHALRALAVVATREFCESGELPANGWVVQAQGGRRVGAPTPQAGASRASRTAGSNQEPVVLPAPPSFIEGLPGTPPP